MPISAFLSLLLAGFHFAPAEYPSTCTIHHCVTVYPLPGDHALNTDHGGKMVDGYGGLHQHQYTRRESLKWMTADATSDSTRRSSPPKVAGQPNQQQQISTNFEEVLTLFPTK
mmetsp:Transcript_23434/g.67529  ORF Transcript_23434/g.67529 Transcript_23434/m.67529 type:complete len:113 (-) Transcript_23434:146-484(-)